jgi:hypothetical protein
MSAKPNQLRDSATAAHVLPLMVFLGFVALTSWLRIENPELPWYQRAPEHWVYPLQTLACGGLLLWFRRHYILSPLRGLSLAAVLGALGILIWITPAWLFTQLATNAEAPYWWRWLGLVRRDEGFDPTVLSAWPVAEMGAIAMRFVRMVLVVPLVEEVMWRGFLMRYLNAVDGDWRAVPFGTHTWRGFWVVTFMVMLAHNPEDYAAAFIWGALVYYLAIRTRSLGACVIMHAIGNFLLGIYALSTRQWGFW